jgi:hypothetical protein
MKSAAILLLVLAPAWPQPAKPVALSNPAVPKFKQYKIAPQTFRDLERRFDIQLEGMVRDPNEPVDVLGPTRGLYIENFGVVFTAEVSLVKTPELTPFLKEIPKAMADRIHQRRIERLPLLETAMQDMLHAIARTFMQVPNDEQVVLAVRLLYGSWENTVGMPAQIMLRATRAGVQTGEIIEEKQ